MDKSENKPYKRKYQRYKRMFFSIEEGPLAIFTLPDNKMLPAIIMDLSLGGLGLSIRKNEDITINMGDHLFLTEIKGIASLRPITNIETEIKWIQNYKAFKHILFGCEFMNPSPGLREEIQHFINSWVEDMDIRR